MKRLHFVLRSKLASFTIILLLLVMSCNWFGSSFELDPSSSENWVRFESEVKPISLEYLKNWVAFNTSQGSHGDEEVIAYLSGPTVNLPAVTIAYRQMSDPSLSEVADWGESREGQNDDYVSHSLKAIEIAGRPALLRSYSFTIRNSVGITCYHTYLADKDDAYLVEMCARQKQEGEELEAIWQHMINSIRIE